MNLAGSPSSPAYKNLKIKPKQSPVELKEKMRRNYKDRVHNCRNMLMNKLRGVVVEADLRNTLTEIYKGMFNFTNEQNLDEEEYEVLEEIKNELVQEELSWCIQEYEKSQLDNVDWSSIEQDNNVICPVCQKDNFLLTNDILSCNFCQSVMKTNRSLMEIGNTIVSAIDKHNSTCNKEVQFSTVAVMNESHIYLICDTCNEMQLII